MINYGLVSLVISLVAFIVPFLPPRHGNSKWIIPQTFADYLNRLNLAWTSLFAIIIIGFIIEYLRLRIDIGFGQKKVRTSKILEIINLGTFKILVLNTFALHILKEKKDGFKTVNINHIIKTNRTITFRLLNYHITEK